MRKYLLIIIPFFFSGAFGNKFSTGFGVDGIYFNTMKYGFDEKNLHRKNKSNQVGLLLQIVSYDFKVNQNAVITVGTDSKLNWSSVNFDKLSSSSIFDKPSVKNYGYNGVLAQICYSKCQKRFLGLIGGFGWSVNKFKHQGALNDIPLYETSLDSKPIKENNKYIFTPYIKLGATVKAKISKRAMLSLNLYYFRPFIANLGKPAVSNPEQHAFSVWGTELKEERYFAASNGLGSSINIKFRI